jgi:hypothetical protein
VRSSDQEQPPAPATASLGGVARHVMAPQKIVLVGSFIHESETPCASGRKSRTPGMSGMKHGIGGDVVPLRGGGEDRNS